MEKMNESVRIGSKQMKSETATRNFSPHGLGQLRSQFPRSYSCDPNSPRHGIKGYVVSTKIFSRLHAAHCVAQKRVREGLLLQEPVDWVLAYLFDAEQML